jgi:hypothetical protein
MQDPLQTVISQFANSPTIVQLVTNFNTYIDPRTNIDDFFDLVWNVDTAQGYGLDVWGRIVGVQRVLEISSGTFFGFEASTGGGGQASGVGFNQAPFFSVGSALTSNFSLLDDPFRALILAKALFNICDGSIPAFNQILINIFGANGPLPVAGNSYVTDSGGMAMTYTFSSTLDPVQEAIVFQSGVLPRLTGVAATVVQP